MAKYIIARASSDELMHYGIKGQKWGIRRYQNDDGTWTAAGKERYGVSDDRQSRKFMKLANKSNAYGDAAQKAQRKLLKSKKMKELLNDDEIRAKKEAYDKANAEWFKESKGEDFDAYDPNGHDYGISEKKFKKIQTLSEKKYKAWDNLDETVRERVKQFTGDYANQSASKYKQENVKFDDINRWISIVTMVELNRKKSGGV